MTATLQEQCLIRYRWSAKWCTADLAAQRYTSSSLSRGGEGCGKVSQQRTATFAMEKLSTAEEKGGPTNIHDTGGGGGVALMVKVLWLLGQLDEEWELTSAHNRTAKMLLTSSCFRGL